MHMLGLFPSIRRSDDLNDTIKTPVRLGAEDATGTEDSGVHEPRHAGDQDRTAKTCRL